MKKNCFPRQRTTAALGVILLMATFAPGQWPPGTVDLADLDTAPVLAYGQNASDQLRVLATGDFNGDGLDDILLGSHLADFSDLQRVNVGAAYIILGAADGFTLHDLGDEEKPGQDVLFLGADDEDHLGLSAASGDVNGDGVDDIIIGAPGADGPSNSRNSCGELYIFFGGPHLISGTTRDAKGEQGQGPDITIYGKESFDGLGRAVAIGHVDGGAPDLIITAPGASGPNETRPFAGGAYVFLDDEKLTSPGVVDLADPLVAADVVIHGANPVDLLGFAVKTGDLNSDGFDDIVVSAPTASGSGSLRRNAGEVYVMLGRRDFAAQIVRDMSGFYGAGADVVIYGQDTGDALGIALAMADISGDQVSDLMISSGVGGDGPENERATAGEVYVILGSPRFQLESARDLAGHVGRPADLTLFGAETDDEFGFSLAVSDVSGDGVPDLIIGAPLADGPDNERADAGEVYVFFGGRSLFNGVPRDVAGQVGALPEVTFIGPSAGVNFGATLATADLVGHQTIDLIVGAPLASGPDNTRTNSGTAYVISGG